MLTTRQVNDFLDETASSSPAPGGGSVSALAGALSAALTSMVCQLTIGKKKYADVEGTMKDILATSEKVRARMQETIDEDTLAFQEVMKAFGLPKETEDQKTARSAAIQEATKRATDVPLGLVRMCATCVGLVEAVAAKGNKNSQSDAGVAALLLGSAVRGAAMNVYINLSGLSDQDFVSAVRQECETIEADVSRRCDAVAHNVRSALLG